MRSLIKAICPLVISVVAACASAKTTTVDLGTLRLVVSDSETAQLFHIVDQLSQWDENAHKQYVRWGAKDLALDDADRNLFQQHAEMRHRRGWERGFEQAFLVEDSIPAAAEKAVEAGLLTRPEADAEREILLHFAPKLEPLLTKQQSEIDSFREKVLAEAPRLTPIVAALSRFSEMPGAAVVPAFLVANPDATKGGGEANSGRLVLEIPSPDPFGFLLHESLHALLRPQQLKIRAAAQSAGLAATTLNEGIAYAFAPGITDDIEQNDTLAEQVARLQFKGSGPTDSYLQRYVLALVIRPVIRAALTKHKTISEVLPDVIQTWRKVTQP